MPKHIVAHRSTAHRLACWSLYRLLLRKSQSLPDAQAEYVTTLIRGRFRNDRKLQSPAMIAESLQAGQEGLNLLRSVENGDSKSVERLGSLLESTLKLAKEHSIYRSAAFGAVSAGLSPQETMAAPKDADKGQQDAPICSKPVFERPLPLSEIKGGVRRVPRLISPHGIPILTYSKGMSPVVGGIFRKKVKRDIARWNQKAYFDEELIPLAETEDQWDTLVGSLTARENKGHESSPRKEDIKTNHGLWASAPRDAEKTLSQTLRDDDLGNMERARKLFGVVLKERELAAQETQQKE